MASLSNINGLFDVHSTGAILFSTSHGTSGQILKSNGNAAPTWIPQSDIVGAYLPLAGGTLTGATATASGISFTVGGALTGTTSSFVSPVAGTTVVSAEGAYAGNGSVKLFEAKRNGGAVKSDWDYHDSSPIRMSIGTNTSHNFAIKTADTPRLTILSSGNVGIGVIDPDAKLEIKGTGSVAGLTFKTTDASSNETFFIQDGGRTGVRYYPLTVGQASGTSAASGARFQVVTTAGDFVVMSDGKTGIGTTSPAARLDVRNAGQGGIEFWPEGLAVAGTNLINNYDRTGDNFVDFEIRAAQYNWKIGTSSKMVMLSSGNVGIGTTSPSTKLEVKMNDTANNRLGFTGDGSTTGAAMWTNWQTGNSYLDFRLGGITSTYTKMRITSAGELYVGHTSTNPANGLTVVDPSTGTYIQLDHVNGTVSGSIFSLFRYNQSVIGSITQNGSSQVSFNISSDYRLKEDLQDFNGLDKVSKIPVYDFKWKTDESRSYGVMAHELQEVLPDAVTGEKDAEEMQQVDYSKIVPLLVKSIQELEAKIKILENK